MPSSPQSRSRPWRTASFSLIWTALVLLASALRWKICQLYFRRGKDQKPRFWSHPQYSWFASNRPPVGARGDFPVPRRGDVSALSCFSLWVGCAPGRLLSTRPTCRLCWPSFFQPACRWREVPRRRLGPAHRLRADDPRFRWSTIPDQLASPSRVRERIRLHGALIRQQRELNDANRELRDEMAERRKAEARLRQAEKMEALETDRRGGHDFNNLLTVILGNLDMIARRPHDAGRVERLANSASAAGQRGAELTEKLLSLPAGRSCSLRP